MLVFRFIIEYSSLEGFWPLGIVVVVVVVVVVGLFFIQGSLKDDILACVESCVI